MSNLNKATKAELIKMVEAMSEKLTTLQHENQKLNAFYYKASQDLILAAELIEPGFEGDIHELLRNKTMLSQAKNGDASKKDPLVRLEEAKQPVARTWLGEKLGMEVAGIVYANKARTNFGIVLPEKETRNAKLANLVKAARAAGYASNYWGSEGVWLAPMKKQE